MEQIKPNSPAVVANCVFVLLVCLVSLYEGIRMYRQRRSWINFIILRNASGATFAMILILFGISLDVLNPLSPQLVMKIFYCIGFIGAYFHLMVSFYRFKIFECLYPSGPAKWIISIPNKPFFIAFGLLTLATFSVMILHVTSGGFFALTTAFFFIFHFCWVITDNTITILSIQMCLELKGVRKSLGPTKAGEVSVRTNKLNEKQVKYLKICMTLLVVMLLSDLITLPELFLWEISASKSGSFIGNDIRGIVCVTSCSLVFHIAITFIYMHYLLRLMLCKNTTTTTAGTSGSSAGNLLSQDTMKFDRVASDEPVLSQATSSSVGVGNSKEPQSPKSSSGTATNVV
eukprot:TRINITY_DN1630_c0_g1_i1.p1 TRINITY_DN1630_c0_g1~~TRINITY_DN1630_c0_g1_i1.p1  ORF type:complete len:345 (-),score=90.44 TRINITY_DN1630_c0_g1_i1:35-1069(-)